MQDLQGGRVSRHGKPLTFYMVQCAIFPLFYMHYNTGQRPLAGPGFEPEFRHLLDCDLEQIPQSKNHVPHLYKMK